MAMNMAKAIHAAAVTEPLTHLPQESPMKPANDAMESWAKALRDIG